MTGKRPPLRRTTHAALDIVKALRQDRDLKTYDDVVCLLLEEYAAAHSIPEEYLLLDSARSDRSGKTVTSGKSGKK